MGVGIRRQPGGLSDPRVPKELLKHAGGGRAWPACSWWVGELQEPRFHKEAVANIQARNGGGGAAWVIEADGPIDS